MFAGRVVRRWLAAFVAVLLGLGGAVLTAGAASAAPTPQTCSYAPAGQGAYSRTLCWLDMSGYSDAVAGSAAGQEMVLNLPGGYTMTYTLQRSGRQIASSPLPIIPSIFIGTPGRYAGVSGQPGLYQVNRAVDPATSSTLQMTNISMRDGEGNPVTAFAIVGVDAETTTTGETDTWTSDKPMSQLIPIGNACNPVFTGVGTTSVVCGANDSNSWTGTAMLAAQNPTFMTQRMQNASTGRQGVAFAVLLSKVELNKVVNGRVDAGDAFDLTVSTPTGATLASASTGSASTATTGEVETIGSTVESAFTLAESSAPSPLTNYTSVWACTRNGAPDPGLPTGQAGASAEVSLAIGDLVACTVTNTAKSVGLYLQKVAGTPVDVNGNGITDAGDTIGYTFELKNIGELPLANVRVDDPLVGQVLCPPGVLEPGLPATCTSAVDYVITADDASRGAVLNTAVAVGTPPGTSTVVPSNTSSTNTPVLVATPALSLVKSASPTSASAAGQTIEYFFDVTNVGNVPIGDLDIAEGTFTGTGPAPVAVCPVSSLAPATTTRCTATYTTTQADIDAGSVTNTATATGTAGGPVTSPETSATFTAERSPALALEKSVSPSSAASFVVGQELTYSFVVSNTGNVTVENVSLLDIAFSGSGSLSPITCGPEASAVSPAEQVTCTATYTITQADIDAGTLENTARATGTTPTGGVVSPDDSATMPAAQGPEMTIEKSADPQTVTGAAETISYRFLVKNTGNVTLTGIAVTETSFSGTGTAPVVSCPPEAAQLLPGQEATCTADYVTTQADADAGVVTNTAIATGAEPGGATITAPPSTIDVPITAVRALSLIKTATPGQVAAAGDVVDYSFLVTNTGTVTLTGIAINDTDFTGTGAPLTVTCPAQASSLAPNAAVTCTASYTVTQADIDAGSISNTATASGIPPGGGDPIDSTPFSALVPAAQTANLTVIKTSAATTVSAVGESIEYSYTVTNTGNVTLTDVRIIEGVFTGVGAVQPPVCPAGAASLAPGASVVCTSTAEVTQADLDAGRVLNTASAAGDPPQGDPAFSPPSTVDVPATVSPAISLEKTVSPTSVTAAGQNVTYTFAVTNTGNVTLSGVSVVDGQFTGTGPVPVPSCPPEASSLAPGTTATCTAQYTVTQADIDAGHVTNDATAQGNPPGADAIVSAPTEATFTAIAAPSLTLLKTASSATYASGQPLTYTFVITNTGNQTMTDVSVDELTFTGTGPTPVPACAGTRTLAPGQSLTCTADYTPTNADVTASHTDNVARATGLAQGPSAQPVVSDPSAAVITATAAGVNSALTLTKTVDPAQLDAPSPGTVLNYLFVVANTGDVPLTGMAVVETLFTGSGPAPTITCPPGASLLDPGSTVICSASYELTTQDILAGSVRNTALANATDPDGNEITSAASQASTTFTRDLPATGANVLGLVMTSLLLALLGTAAVLSSSRLRRP